MLELGDGLTRGPHWDERDRQDRGVVPEQFGNHPVVGPAPREPQVLFVKRGHDPALARVEHRHIEPQLAHALLEEAREQDGRSVQRLRRRCPPGVEHLPVLSALGCGRRQQFLVDDEAVDRLVFEAVDELAAPDLIEELE